MVKNDFFLISKKTMKVTLLTVEDKKNVHLTLTAFTRLDV
jgi:hypothetical protein